MKLSRPKTATGVLLAALALTSFGCGSGDSGNQDKNLVNTDGGGTRQVTGTTGGETGGSTTGGTTGGEESGLSPALIMTIVN